MTKSNNPRQPAMNLYPSCYLTIKEREMLMCLKDNRLSIRAITLLLGRSPSTISRKLKRCFVNYSASDAERDYHKKRQNCHKPLLLELHPQLCQKIAYYILKLHWSPEQIAS